MLKIVVGGNQMFDDSTQEFVIKGGVELELEHSLASLSKWESEFEKVFLKTEDKTDEELIGYVKAMTLTPNVPPGLFYQLSERNLEEINAYINKRMTATWFRDAPGAPQTRDVITSELIYYWMTVFNIPFTCDQWHLNRLFTLIRVCSAKQDKPKKMSRGEAAAQQRMLNEQRRRELGTKG